MVSYTLSVPLALLAAAAIVAYLERGGFGRWLVAAAACSVVFLVHVTAPMIVGPAGTGGLRRRDRPRPARGAAAAHLAAHGLLGDRAGRTRRERVLVAAGIPARLDQGRGHVRAWPIPNRSWAGSSTSSGTRPRRSRSCSAWGSPGCSSGRGGRRSRRRASGASRRQGSRGATSRGISARSTRSSRGGIRTRSSRPRASRPASSSTRCSCGCARAVRGWIGGRHWPSCSSASDGWGPGSTSRPASSWAGRGGGRSYPAAPRRRYSGSSNGCKKHVEPGERLLFEETGKAQPGRPDPFGMHHFSAMLPQRRGRRGARRPLPHATVTTNFTQFGEGKLFGKSDWGRNDFVRYAKLYRPAAILCWSPEARVFCLGNPELIEVLEDDGTLLLGRVRGFEGRHDPRQGRRHRRPEPDRGQERRRGRRRPGRAPLPCRAAPGERPAGSPSSRSTSKTTLCRSSPSDPTGGPSCSG